MKFSCKIIQSETIPLLCFETVTGTKELFDKFLIETTEKYSDKVVIGTFNYKRYVYQDGIINMVEDTTTYIS